MNYFRSTVSGEVYSLPDHLAASAPNGSERVVVISPENRQQVERLLNAYDGKTGGWDKAGYIDRLQTALRSLVTPPKPEEPQGLGAVVEDAKNIRWVRVNERLAAFWRPVDSAAGSFRNYHRVHVTFDNVSPFPTVRFECYEPEGADCWCVCPASSCEEGCTDPGVEGHERKSIGYCNVTEWLNNMDEVESAILGRETTITRLIAYEWAGSDIGPEWRFA